MFDIACEVLGVWTPYAIEKRLMGDAFLPDERSRWWEKLRYDRLDLPRALQRGDRASRIWMDRLSGHTSDASKALAMPLWPLSSIGRVSVEAVMTWRTSIEAMGTHIPELSARSMQSARQYVDQLYEPLRAQHTIWAAANVALFCMRLAQACGGLANYALTYETIASERWRHCMMGAGTAATDTWQRLRLFYGEWFSTLQLHITKESELCEAIDALSSRGLSTHAVSRCRQDDERYALVNSLSRGNSAPSSTERSILIFA
ncbi:hypothetical protein [Paraburkholderia piptadeniae]|uniref:hypothetical protein n=1 Tax=Paraburkholderia piptadeniae TaxID=1701573 RepID=UPI0011813854|nr:hypothetical protein [Paraburkholderia piptadeniae]